MKKPLLFFLVTILCLVMLYSCTSTCEKENPVSDFEYTENEDGGITITKYKGERTEVVIPDKINEKNVTAIGPKAFMLGTEYDPIESPITQVDIPDTVTHIGEGAFYYCTRLKEFVPPKNLEVVGDFAFAGCA
ncbi:MAG: leucine-rich repeat domain-containing protein, partial [Clostridia bacterium]|nr:leucine-rich repeat domain-containing protein [Clostridia bacterium]